MGDSGATVNGDMPQSSFLSHLNSYPVISHSVDAISHNPYGAKGIDLTNQCYATFVKPTFPYLQTPYSYTKPYIAKADQLGDIALAKIDETFPVVKSEPDQIKSTIFDIAHFPLKKAGETKEWVLTTYNEEYKKCGGDGIVAGGKALITTQLVLTGEVLGWVNSFLQSKKEEAKDKTGELKEKAQS